MPLLGNPHQRAHFVDLLERGIAQVYFNELEIADSGILEQLYNMKTSEKAVEHDVVVAGLNVALPMSEGSDPQFDNMQEAWKVDYTALASGIATEFTHESIEDNLYLTLGKEMAQELARTMSYTRTIGGMDLFNDSTKVIYTYAAVTHTLLDTAHPLVSGGTWGNKRTQKVLLSQEALEDAIQAWSNQLVDLRGRKYVVQPALLVHGPQDRFLVQRLLNTPTAQGRPQSADNDINPLAKLNITPFCNPHQTDDGRWFLFAPKRNLRLKYWDREKPMMKRVDSTTNWNVKMMSYMRNSHGASSPEGIWGS